MKNSVSYILIIFSLFAFSQDNACDGNCLHGYGTYTFSNKDVYEGQWVNRNNVGTMEGYGRIIYANGDKYEGQFRNDMPNGLGKLTYKSGNIFEVTFVNGVINGFGRFRNDDQMEIGKWYGTKNIDPIKTVRQAAASKKYQKFLEAWENHNNKWQAHVKRWNKNEVDNNMVALPPYLTRPEENIIFEDDDKILDAGETSYIKFVVKNEAKDANAIAKNIRITVSSSDVSGSVTFDVSPSTIPNLQPGESKAIEISIHGGPSLRSGKQAISINIDEESGWGAAPISLTINTRKEKSPELKITSTSANSAGEFIERAQPIQYQFIIQNIGQGVAENVYSKAWFDYSFGDESEPIQFLANELHEQIDTLRPNESKKLSVELISTRKYRSDSIYINLEVFESEDKYGCQLSDTIVIGDSSYDLDYSAMDFADADIEIEEVKLISDIDIKDEIPIRDKIDNRYALVIGNENYSSTYHKSEADVDYALNDANVFKEYAIKTLGVFEDNVYYLEDANAEDMKDEIEFVCELLEIKTNKGENVELLFYYAGHGFPDKKNKPYLIPIGVTASNVEAGIPLSSLYSDFSNTGAQTFVFLDACFSGGARGTGLEESRRLRITPREERIESKLIVFAATSENQTALPYDDEKHGIFTYHLLKKLKETKGNITLGELEKHLSLSVRETALEEKRSKQEPKILLSEDLVDTYKNLNLH